MKVGLFGFAVAISTAICSAALADSLRSDSDSPFDGYKEEWHSGDMNEGGHAISFLKGDFTGNETTDLLQLFVNKSGGNFGLTVYQWQNSSSGYKNVFSQEDMEAGVTAFGWLAGDIDADKQDEIIQAWANGGSLGIAVYGWDKTNKSASQICNNVDAGGGPVALAWLLADFNGDGKQELAQPFASGGSLGLQLYGWTSTANCMASMREEPSYPPNAGTPNIMFLAGDINGDEKDEIVQLYIGVDNSLATAVYGWDQVNGFQFVCNQASEGGAYGLEYFLADFDGDGSDELIQLWPNGGALGIAVYKWESSSSCFNPTYSYYNSNLGGGTPALQFLVADVNNDSKLELLQFWGNGYNVQLTIYGWVGEDYTRIWDYQNSEIPLRAQNAIMLVDVMQENDSDILLVDYEILTGRQNCEPLIGPICLDYCWCDQLQLTVLTPVN